MCGWFEGLGSGPSAVTEDIQDLLLPGNVMDDSNFHAKLPHLRMQLHSFTIHKQHCTTIRDNKLQVKIVMEKNKNYREKKKEVPTG